MFWERGIQGFFCAHEGNEFFIADNQEMIRCRLSDGTIGIGLSVEDAELAAHLMRKG